jgi:hypothetical protein
VFEKFYLGASREHEADGHPLQEQQRSVVRYREQLVRNRRRAEARGRALALTQGILAPVGWWRPAAWKQLKSQLPEWMSSQLENCILCLQAAPSPLSGR